MSKVTKISEEVWTLSQENILSAWNVTNHLFKSLLMNLGPMVKDPGYFHLHRDSHLETVLAGHK